MRGFIEALAAYALGAFLGLLAFSAISRADQYPPSVLLLREVALKVRGDSCSGSGSIVEGKSGQQYLLTNAHVCNCARDRGHIRATYDNDELVVGKEHKRDWAVDLCVAKVPKQRKALKLAPAILPLMALYTRGYAGGGVVESSGRANGEVDWQYEMQIEDVGECPKITEKTLHFNGNTAGCLINFHSSRTNLYGRPGSSGSPVVNSSGELLGVVSSYMPGDDYDIGLVTFDQLSQFMKGL